MWLLFEAGLIFGRLVSKRPPEGWRAQRPAACSTVVNLLLLEDADFLDACHVRLQGRRLQHLREVHRAEVGSTLRVGRISGDGPGPAAAAGRSAGRTARGAGSAATRQAAGNAGAGPAAPEERCSSAPCRPLRPWASSRLVLLNSYRVEKSFWQTLPRRAGDSRAVLLGLEQARDTLLPEVHIEQRFKPFVEDRLPGLAAGTLGLLGHPGDFAPRGVSNAFSAFFEPSGAQMLGLIGERLVFPCSPEAARTGRALLQSVE